MDLLLTAVTYYTNLSIHMVHLSFFVFIEAIRKHDNNNNGNLIISRIENAIPLSKIFQYFISVFESEESLKKKIKNKTNIYEFDDEKINVLSNALKITNPDVYQRLSETKKSIIS